MLLSELTIDVMKTNPFPPLSATSTLPPAWSHPSAANADCLRRRLVGLLLTLCLLLARSPGYGAGALTWDANPTTTGAQDGGGNWGDPNQWWNGSANVNWADGNYAILGAVSGSAGVFSVTNNLALAQPYCLVFTNPGSYTVTGNGTVAGNIQNTASGGNSASFSPGIYVATNVNAHLDTPWRNQSGSDIFLGSNSVLTISQPMFNSSGTVWIKGSGPQASTLYLTNGAFGVANYISGTFCVMGATLDISGTGSLNTGTRFDLSRSGIAGAPVANSVVNIHDGGQLNVDTASTSDNNANFQLSRGGPAATVNVLPGGTLTTLNKNASGYSNGKLLLVPDNGAAGPVLLNVSGGVVSVGQGALGTPGINAPNLAMITLMQGGTGYGNTALAIFNLSGGLVAAQGLQIGPASGTFTTSPTNKVNITGGTLYLDAPNISHPVNTGTNFAVNLSGGTVAATGNWSPACTVPMNLTNINGDITFQAADLNGTAFNISLAGALTGLGGLKKTGAGTLTLSGANTYAGTTVISNGTLAVSTLNAPANGPVTVEGATVAAGLPVSSVVVGNVGQSWSIGTLTYDTGIPTADFNFGSFPPSTTVAPIQVNGNLVFTVMPQVSVEGTAIAVGDYPLWHYTGTLSGTPPTAPSSLPSGAVATILRNDAAKTVYLHVSASLVSPRLMWAIGNGAWDTTTANWKQFGSTAKYSDGSLVGFDDTATGPAPIAITLNTSVSPGNIQVNTTNSYAISGTGTITGGTGVEKDGPGTLTLAGTNSYSGGTIVNAGQLNINYGGDGFANSAVGLGPLTNVLGSKLDNTSGHDVTLLTPIALYWNDDFTYVGTGNFNTGPGTVTLGSGLVNLTVVSNVFEVDGPIQDQGLVYGLGKAGAGALTLASYNTFAGGLQLTAGKLNVNAEGAVGSGIFLINGGILDNTSGAAVTLTTPSAMQWAGSFTYAGSADLTIGPVTLGLLADPITVTVNNSNFTTLGVLNGGNRTVNKAGPGTWTLGGGGANGGVGININAGTVNFDKAAGSTAVNANAVTVNTNATLFFVTPTGTQLGSLVPLTLNGGLIDVNGDSETFNSLTIISGVLRNSAGGSTSALHPAAISLGGTNGTVDVTNTATLTLSATITNTGWLIKTGGGQLTLISNNTYTGSTLINAGTLALADPQAIGAGSISNSPFISIGAGATLDVSGRMDQTFTLVSGQTLAGSGGLNGMLVALPGSTVAPGSPAAIGTLAASNNVTLGGALLLKISRTNTPSSDALLAVGGTVTYGGVLAITNIGSGLQVGDTFQLFPTAATGFASVVLPSTDASGNLYVWANKVAVDGSIQVTAVQSSVNPTPTNITAKVSGSNLTLSWPADHTGWRLLMQTNRLQSGVSTNLADWGTVAGSAATNQVSLPIDPAKPCEFFRMVYP